MGLSSSMWTGVTGMQANSEKMGVIGNNLANVNTYGFKSQRMDFEDLVSQNLGTASGIKQVGTGVRVSTIMNNFAQGGYESSTNSTDMAVGGLGFFMVKTKASTSSNADLGNRYYTRAGNFNFNKNGYLTDPHGYILQGWQVDNAKIATNNSLGIVTSQVPVKGTLTDVRLDAFQLSAKATTSMTVAVNLDPTSKGNSTSVTDPYFSMFQNYNYDTTNPSNPALSSTSYNYQTTMKVYDQNGGSHNVTVYYDKVSNVGGREYWEYMVACNPQEDGRSFETGPQTGTGLATTTKAGVLAIGTLTFGAGGALENMSAFTLKSGSTSNTTLGQWQPAAVSNGYPVLTGNFRKVSNASFVDSTAKPVNIKLDMGLRTSSDVNPWVPAGITDASMIGTNLANLTGFQAANVRINNLATTNLTDSSSTLYTAQDGYPPGLLQTISVDRDGILNGTFSNGQVQSLYAIALVDFTNSNGLRREGGNLFSETVDSGQARTDRANTGRLGSVAGNTLETSNVDMATEMVNMITTQRAFQGNTKVITTADSLLAEVIQLKR